MFLLPVNSFADEYNLLTANYDNYAANISVTLSVSEPLTMLKALGEKWNISNYADVQKLGESLCDTEISGVVKYSANSDYSRIKASYEVYSAIPIEVNRNFKSTNELKLGMWLDWDMTDENNPRIRYIYSLPMYDKYVVSDMEALAKIGGFNASEYAAKIKNILNREYIEKLSSEFANVLRENSSLTYQGTTAVVTMTEKQLAGAICDVLELISEQSESDTNELVNEEPFFAALPTADDVKKFFDEVRIFDDDAVVIKISKTQSGVLKNESCKINMCIGKELLSKTIGEEDAEDLEDLKFSVNIETAYTGVNNGVKIVFPEIDDENSISIADAAGIYENDYTYAYDWNGEDCLHYEYIYTEGEYTEAVPNTFYVNLNSFIEDCARYGYDYTLKNENGAVTLADESGNEIFDNVSMTVGSVDIMVNSKQYTALNPILVKGGNIYVDTEVIKYIFNADMSDCNLFVLDGRTDIEFSRKSPQCRHTQEEIDSQYDYDNEYDYCSHIQYIYTDSDGEVYYVPFREMCRNFYCYDEEKFSIGYDNGVVTLTDLSGKEKFKTAVFTVGSYEYSADGTELKAQQPTYEKNDLVYVDVRALSELFGAKTESIRGYYNPVYNDDGGYVGGSINYAYYLERKSPDCIHTSEELAADGWEY